MAVKKKKREPKQSGTTACAVCGTTFFYHSRTIPVICGESYCQAMHEWGEEEWQDAARMAAARVVAGFEVHVDHVSEQRGDEMREANAPVTLSFDKMREEYSVASTHPVTLSPIDIQALMRYPHEQEEKDSGTGI